MPDPAKAGEAFRTYLEKDGGMNQITNGLSRVVDMKDLEKQVTGIVEENSAAFGESISTAISGAMTSVMGIITTQIADSMQKSMESFASQIPNAISFDTSVFARAFTMAVDPQDMEDLVMSLMSSAQYTYDGNLRKFGYADLNKPATISIYPRDFDSKAEVIKLLDSYNDEMRKVDEDKVITYTDFVGTLMSSVTTIVDTVSYVLIAFVAISLVVSSIMIGVITYISVLERRKEIGILRAIGASKRNISEVFNAETFIIGLLAGLFGIGITRLLLIPGNYLIHTIADNQSVNAYLPVRSGLILIALSVVLTLIGGIIPSRKAAKSDPVTALRTE
jgi:ABC-type antimicrobial peptide transport system permease subunit